jgi:hypothetical protein
VEAELRTRKYEGRSKETSPANLRGEPRQERDHIKSLVKNKLVENVNAGRDDGVRSAQLLGRFREHDWWVKDGGDMQFGVFAVLNDPAMRANIERIGGALEQYQDCGWCGECVGDAEALQKHSLVCRNRPIPIQTQPALKETSENA